MTAEQLQQLEALDPLSALRLTIYGEARGEPVEGQIAVGCVIRNRRESGRWGDTFRAVCLAASQFSCWNSHDPNFAELWQMAVYLSHGGPPDAFDRLHAGWKQVGWVAEGVSDGRVSSNVSTATHYVTKGLFQQRPPSWAVGATPCATKGSHVFFEGIR
jgi:N-acetylmuramoyl-L-alanine amidase